MTTLVVSGPADYDATNGSAFDVSDYVSSIYSLDLQGVTAKADALINARYVNDDFTDADGGAVYFTWDSSTAADAVFENVTDTTNLSGYVWQVLLIGAPA
jgi:hypothetical protein